MFKQIIFLIIFTLSLPSPSAAEVIKGVYGVPSISSGKADPDAMLAAGVNAVFVSADKETIAAFKTKGFKVFVSANVFGGKGAWKKYPDSRPVKADGTLLGSEPGYKGYGGVCPTHEQWRRDRLAYIAGLVRDYGGPEGIDGIWLDFIRYPGQWERADPDIPDTCYCDRCLKKFAESELSPNFTFEHTMPLLKASRLIAQKHALEWMRWKKTNIQSFVADTRRIIDDGKRQDLVLGIFAVPWKKGERNNAISFQLAQDIGHLSRLADVIAPMTYYNMVGKSPQWVGAITRYFQSAAQCQVWPIIQSMQVNWTDYGQTFDAVAGAGTDGILVFKQGAIQGAMWREFKTFKPPENLIANPDFDAPAGKVRPTGWRMKTASGSGGKASRYMVVPSDKLPLRPGRTRDRKPFKSIGILAGNDRAGEWSRRLPGCLAGNTYRFKGTFYRPFWKNGLYPEIRLWGQPFLLNTSWLSKTFQPIDVLVTCPETAADNQLRFINNSTGYSFWLAKPELKEFHPVPKAVTSGQSPAFYNGLFPIGAYGANLQNLAAMKAAGLNTAIIGGSIGHLKQAVKKCHALGLNYMVSIPRDPDRLVLYLEKMATFADPSKLSFYVNDEPGIHSFPVHTAEDIQSLIKSRFPGAPTTMAVVRSPVAGKYAAAADYFMLDQYPVPHMPMTWLSDSMDRAAEDVGPKRLAAVIQAFGGPDRARQGWPRAPSRQELDCLTFLSVIHGGRAIFFFTFREIGKTAEGRKKLGWVTDRINTISPWLLEYNLAENATVRMVSANRVDSKGKPAIHCCLKKKGGQLMLLATNTIGNYTEAEFKVPGVVKGLWQETFGKDEVPVVDGTLRVRFGPFETKVYIIDSF